jgi:hypothetical protein
MPFLLADFLIDVALINHKSKVPVLQMLCFCDRAFYQPIFPAVRLAIQTFRLLKCRTLFLTDATFTIQSF